MMMLTTVINGALGLAATITASFITVDIERQVLMGDPNYPYIAILAEALDSVGGAVTLAVGGAIIAMSKITTDLIVESCVFADTSKACRSTQSQRLLVRVGPLLVMGEYLQNNHSTPSAENTLTNPQQSGLPFSNWFMRIRTVDGAPLPVNSILASLCICVIIALLNLGGRKIFNSIVGLLTGTLGLTYALSIGCVLWRRCYGAPLPPARWSLGCWGIPLNIIALLYMLTSSIISFFPIFNGTDVANMNW
jgi:hypothetical protein